MTVVQKVGAIHELPLLFYATFLRHAQLKTAISIFWLLTNHFFLGDLFTGTSTIAS